MTTWEWRFCYRQWQKWLRQGENMVRAASLAAATESLLTSINGALQPDERNQQDKTIATVREALGEAFQSAWEESQRLTMKEAVELRCRKNNRY